MYCDCGYDVIHEVAMDWSTVWFSVMELCSKSPSDVPALFILDEAIIYSGLCIVTVDMVLFMK